MREGGQVGSNARNSCSAGGRIGGNSHDDFLIVFFPGHRDSQKNECSVRLHGDTAGNYGHDFLSFLSKFSARLDNPKIHASIYLPPSQSPEIVIPLLPPSLFLINP